MPDAGTAGTPSPLGRGDAAGAHPSENPPGGPDAAGRQALLAEIEEALRALGAGEAEIAAASAAGSWAALLTDLILWPDRERLSLAELAGRAGMDEELARRVRSRAGLPDTGGDGACHAGEEALLSSFATGATVFGEEPVLQFSRVLSGATASIAEAARSLFALGIARPLLSGGIGDLEYALVVRDAMVAFQSVPPAVDATLRAQFQQAVERLGEISPDPAPAWAVGFVDLVGSTARAARLRPERMADLLVALEEEAADAAAGHGVRLVKLLGDGAMFAGPELDRLADALAELVQRIEANPDFGGARGGLAWGPITARDGDYFGMPVNLAARATAVAARGAILCDDAAAARLAGRTVPEADFELKGFAHPVALHRLVAAAGHAAEGQGVVEEVMERSDRRRGLEDG